MLVKFCAFSALLFPAASFLAFRVAPQPRFIKVNKTLKKGGFIIEPDFIIFDNDANPVAVSRKCTHLGCKLNYHEQEKMLICPCHKSKFSKNGKRLDGPANRDLKLFTVEASGGPKVEGYIVTII